MESVSRLRDGGLGDVCDGVEVLNSKHDIRIYH